MSIDEVNHAVSGVIRKYDWSTEQYGYGIKLTVTDGGKKASVVITDNEDPVEEAKRLIEVVDKHEFVDLEG